MVCRHKDGDHNCTTRYPQYNQRYEEPKTPDKYKYSIEECEKVGNNLVMKISYPNCKSCSYEGNKVMVFLNVSELDALKWKEIDPHFREPTQEYSKTKAPSPAARFPASEQGWRDAIEYARIKK